MDDSFDDIYDLKEGPMGQKNEEGEIHETSSKTFVLFKKFYETLVNILRETGNFNQKFLLVNKIIILHQALFLYLSYHGTDMEATSDNVEQFEDDSDIVDALCSIMKRDLKQMMTEFDGPYLKEEEMDKYNTEEFKTQTISVVSEMYAVLCFVRGINISQNFTGKRTSIQDIVAFFDANPKFTFVNILKYNDVDYIISEINKMS
jgi:hypothetical protein